MTALAPVHVTSRNHSVRRNGRMSKLTVICSAVSIDGVWSYELQETAKTPWLLTHTPSSAQVGHFATLRKARQTVASGAALKQVGLDLAFGIIEALRAG